MDTQDIPVTDVAWLAGLFEGEGSICIARNGGTRLTIRMCDLDVIERVNKFFPCTKIQVVVPKPAKAGYAQPATQYAWRISNPDTVREVLELLLPWFGQRRAAKAREILAHLDSRPGIGGHNRRKTHCAQGHEYTPENTHTPPGTTHRRCKKCMEQWAQTARDRQAARRQVPQAQTA